MKKFKLLYLNVDDARKLSRQEIEQCLHILHCDEIYARETGESRLLYHDMGILQSLLASK